MRILADENLVRVRELFSPYGEVHTVPGRSISAALLRDFDILLVRSVTPVSASLLQGSRCRFVGTATSGIDHVDEDELAKLGIRLAWARGCNSISVVDYVFSVLVALSPVGGASWQQKSVGIIGCGQIGTVLAKKLLQLGMRVRIHDPLLSAEHELASHFTSMREVLQQEIITLHVPLTRTGAAPTFHMLAQAELAQIPAGSQLINAARGAVIDNECLLQWLQKKPEQQVVLDTWENEPGIKRELLQRVVLGTPHIAGYSQQGKEGGTRMVLHEFCQYFGFSIAESKPVPAQQLQLATGVTDNPLHQLNSLILAAYDVRKDHQAMQALLTSTEPAADFDALRKHYPCRHEFSHFRVESAQLHPATREAASTLGFQLSLAS